MPIDKILPQIQHVVVLMMENRSLDSVCGWLYENDAPDHVIGGRPSDPPAYDGLVEGRYSNPLKRPFEPVREYPVTRVPVGEYRLPAFNPNEAYRFTNNQLYGDAESRRYETPPRGTPARCKGFLQDFYALYDKAPEDFLRCYTPQGLQVINTLAKQYAISDRWFSSVPTQTNPNRAFLACGTSLGREQNQRITAQEQFAADTLWNVFSDHGVEWTIYFHDIWREQMSYTQYTFPFINTARNRSGRKRYAQINAFYEDARAGSLPPFTFLEPSWSYGMGSIYKQGNDYHPPARVDSAERFLAQVYAALTANRAAWNKTLLVITFDEHGGTYDHVPPPWTAVRPDNRVGPSGFQFDRYGVRVPTLLVSPYVKPRTVFRATGPQEFDHTSLVATLLKWQDIDPRTAGLGLRVASAPTFEDALGPEPRTDLPAVDEPPLLAAAPTIEEDAVRILADLPVSVGKELEETAENETEFLARVKELRHGQRSG
jgi:phospholipase C